MHRLGIILAVVVSSVFTPAVVAPRSAAAQSATTRFVSAPPCRLVDTRTGEGFIRLTPHVIRVRTSNRCTIGAEPSALAVSVVMVGAGADGYLTLHPTGSPRPNASMLNFAKGQTRSNASIVRVGGNGSFDVYQTTSGHLVIDTTGWFEPVAETASGRFVPITPTRLLDTRLLDSGTGAPIAPGGSVTIPLPAAVSATASALSLNITVTGSTGPGFVSTHAAGTSRPGTSVLNIDAAGQTRASGGLHTVGPDGLTIFLSGGGHLVVDVAGWFTGVDAAVSADGLFVPIAPTRVLDTRQTSPLGTAVPLGPGGSATITRLEQRSPLAFNITSVDGVDGYVTAYPAGTTRPLSSVLNPMGGGEVVANFSIVPTSNDGLELYSLRTTHLLVDLAGWFTPTAEVVSLPPVPPAPTTPPTTTTTPTTAPPTTTTTTTTPTTTTTTTTAPPTTTTTTIPQGARAVVHLTFDDGPNTAYTPRLLEILARYPDVKATFFVMGFAVAANGQVVRDILEGGHAIGNHTWSHPDLRTLTDDEIRRELERTQAALRPLGAEPGCMRPPYGYVDLTFGPPVTPYNPNVARVITDAGFSIQMWTHDTNDWRPESSVGSIIDVLDGMSTSPGSVSNVLMHDRLEITLDAVEIWLAANSERYDFRAIPGC